jgi:hypothetical protein
MIHLQHGGQRTSFEMDRAQVIATATGVFLRVTTKPSELDTRLYAPIRDSARVIGQRWQIDGIDSNLSCRNVEFVVVERRPLRTSLLVDIYFPLTYAVDVSFTQYTPEEGNFANVFTGTANIAERQTGAFPTVQSTGRTRTHRPVAVANLPRQMRELVEQELVGMGTEQVAATTLNAAYERPVVTDIKEAVAPPPEAQFLRRFDNMVTDDGTED